MSGILAQMCMHVHVWDIIILGAHHKNPIHSIKPKPNELVCKLYTNISIIGEIFIIGMDSDMFSCNHSTINITPITMIFGCMSIQSGLGWIELII